MDAGPNGLNVLVAGGTGTLGLPLVKQLTKLGATVTVAALTPASKAIDLFPTHVTYVRCDLTDYQACQQVCQGQQWVFNLLGIKGSIGIGETRVADYMVAMLRFQTNLMDAAFHAGVEKFLFVSSVNAYPPAELLEEDNLWQGLPKQNDRYPGLAKRIGEVQGETYLQQYGWQGVKIVRLANVYGPHDDFNPATAQVIPALIAKMLAGSSPVEVWGNGEVIRDFIYSEEAAFWLIKAIDELPCCTPVNISNGIPYTIREVAECISTLSPGSPSLQWQANKPSGDPTRLLSIERAQTLLGFKTHTSLEQGIAKTIAWYQENQSQAHCHRENLYENL